MIHFIMSVLDGLYNVIANTVNVVREWMSLLLVLLQNDAHRQAPLSERNQVVSIHLPRKHTAPPIQAKPLEFIATLGPAEIPGPHYHLSAFSFLPALV